MSDKKKKYEYNTQLLVLACELCNCDICAITNSYERPSKHTDDISRKVEDLLMKEFNINLDNLEILADKIIGMCNHACAPAAFAEFRGRFRPIYRVKK